MRDYCADIIPNYVLTGMQESHPAKDGSGLSSNKKAAITRRGGN